jgi:mycoredoxin-dependent peroxiredoxin
MGRRWAVIGVTCATLLSIWGLIQLSSSPGTGTSALSSVEHSQQGTGLAVEAANTNSSNPVVTPNLQQIDAHALLDPIPVGTRAPDFTLTDVTTGKRFTLSSLRGKRNAVMVFYQGSFCSVCGHQLENLQRHLADFTKQDAVVLAISADDVAKAKQTIGEHGLSINVLADPTMTVIKRYGISNLSKRGIAWPSSFVVDKQGMVRLSVADAGGKRLHSNTLLSALGQLTGKPVPQLAYDE